MIEGFAQTGEGKWDNEVKLLHQNIILMPRRRHFEERLGMTTAERTLIRYSVNAVRKLKYVFEQEEIIGTNVPLSLIPYLFLRKSFHVHEAVTRLCKSAMASEAYALSRVLIEMFIVLRWITNEDQNARAKEYGLFVTKRKEYWAEILQRYYPAASTALGTRK